MDSRKLKVSKRCILQHPEITNIVQKYIFFLGPQTSNDAKCNNSCVLTEDKLSLG